MPYRTRWRSIGQSKELLMPLSNFLLLGDILDLSYLVISVQM